MDDNTRRIDRIKEALDCKTDKELADHLKSHPPNITRWKKRGLYPIIANLIDALLEVIESLNTTQKYLFRQISQERADERMSVLNELESYISGANKASKSVNEKRGYNFVLEYIGTCKNKG